MLTLSHTMTTFDAPEKEKKKKKKKLENILEKGEMLVNSISPFSHDVFYS